MKQIVGMNNRVLAVHLTHRDQQVIQISEHDQAAYLGGLGLGLKFLYERLEPGTNPLGEENYLAFMTGVLMGTGGPCSGRFCGLTKSPLTGIMLHSSCGGPFGLALKTAGYDGLLITGKCAAPTYLAIDRQGARFEDARDLWGMDTRTVQAALGAGKKIAALAIGPAGENQVWFANVASGDRFLGRGGMGAVMGSKNLKAIVAHGGAYQFISKNPAQFEEIKKKATAYINRNPMTGVAYRKFGTASHVNWCNRYGILPVRNFRDGSHDKAPNVSGESMALQFNIRHRTCRPCTILCGHSVTLEDGSSRPVPEYESIGLLGPNLGVFDAEKVSQWNEMCGLLGMDTISSGAVLAWAMEAGEKGLIQTALAFDNPRGISETLSDIANRRNFGQELANGTRWLSQKYGGQDFAMHVKGMELPAYDPRGAFGQGLAFAVANRGGCHLSAAVFALETVLGLLNPYGTRAKARWVAFFERLYAAINSLQTCQFTALAYLLEPPIVKYAPPFLLKLSMQHLPVLAIRLMNVGIYTKLYSAVTGKRLSQRSFLKAGERIHTLERWMNTREGISRKDDTLPERWLKESRISDPHKRTVPLERMLDAYYAIAGYDGDGLPTLKKLKKLGLLPKSGDPEPEAISGCKSIAPGGRPLTRLFLSVTLSLVGRAIQAAYGIDGEVKQEFDELPDDFNFALGIEPAGPHLIIGKDARGRPRFLGGKINGLEIDLSLKLKNLTAGVLLFTFKESAAMALVRKRLVVEGQMSAACAVLRILNKVEDYLLPADFARRAGQRDCPQPKAKLCWGRVRIVLRMLAGL